MKNKKYKTKITREAIEIREKKKYRAFGERGGERMARWSSKKKGKQGYIYIDDNIWLFGHTYKLLLLYFFFFF